VPDGDLLVHAGDFTRQGTLREVAAFAEWLRSLPHRHKVVVAGNHDFLFEKEPVLARSLLTGATYLEDEGVTIEGLRIWGSPWQPWFFDWAFNLKRGAPLKAKWDLIPEGTDLLVTHGPPHGILDEVGRVTGKIAAFAMGQGSHVGCEELAKAVVRLRPKVHVFGHIHEGYGQIRAADTLFVNAANCDKDYRPINAPVVLEVG